MIESFAIGKAGCTDMPVEDAFGFFVFWAGYMCLGCKRYMACFWPFFVHFSLKFDYMRWGRPF